MSMPVADNRTAPIESKAELVADIEAGCKPREKWRVGTEHEKFGFRLTDLRPLPYGGPQGIMAMFEGLKRFGWDYVREGENVIALARGRESVSLEPGGQFELSGAPLETIHQTCDEVNTHLREVKTVAEEIGVGFVGFGFNPKWARADIPVMPKGRYGIMTRYMPKRGSLGLDMMYRTCTVQANLDFGSETDMVKKFRVALALQPIATALFANSPFVEGKPVGYASMRSQVWMDTDPDRTGMLPFVFEGGMSFERYVDYALDVPMYFIYRDGQYHEATNGTFRQFLEGKHPAAPGQLPTMPDWGNHLTTLFPEARLKRYLEMRGADGGPWKRLCALPALWVGLLYDQVALDAAWDMVKDWTAEERADLRAGVTKDAIRTSFRKTNVRELSRQTLDIAYAGLKRRNRISNLGGDETHFLNALRDVVESGKTLADIMLEQFKTEWQGSVDPSFKAYAY